MFGVLMCGLPWAAMVSARWSSAKRNRMLGLPAPWARELEQSKANSKPRTHRVRRFISCPFVLFFTVAFCPLALPFVRLLKGAVELRGPGIFELIQMRPGATSPRRRTSPSSDATVERLFLLRIVAEVEELTGAVELVTLIEGKLPDRHVGRLARRIPRVDPVARLPFRRRGSAGETCGRPTSDPEGDVTPAASRSVGRKSVLSTRSAQTMPGVILPGQLAMSGTCIPASVVYPLPPMTSLSPIIERVPRPVPLSPTKSSSVLSRMPSASSRATSLPMSLSM